MDGVSLVEAQYWVNLYLELLEVDQQALRRVRNLARTHVGPAKDCEADLELVQSNVTRVLGRLRHWEDLVDRLQGDRP